MSERKSPLQIHIIELEKVSEGRDLSLDEIVKILGGESHFVLILFFILPFLQPIPLLGLSTPFGFLIGLAALFSILNKPPYVPLRWRTKLINRHTVYKIAEGADKIFEKIGKVFKPRLKSLFQGPFRYINAFIIITNALLLALPLPIPFSNAVPAWVIFIHTVANLERDGAVAIFSYILSLASFAFFILIGYGAKIGISNIPWIQN